MHFTILVILFPALCSFYQPQYLHPVPYFKLFCPTNAPDECRFQCRGRPCTTNCNVDGCSYLCSTFQNGNLCLPAGCSDSDLALCVRWCAGGGASTLPGPGAVVATAAQASTNNFRGCEEECTNGEVQLLQDDNSQFS